MHIALILSVVFAQAFAATTKHHHTAHPPTTPTQSAEYQVLTFKLDPHTNIMMAMVGHSRKCYLYTVSGTEATDVHTPHGLHTLEIKMITAIDDLTSKHTTITHDDLLAASKSLAHACSDTDAQVFKLN